MIQIPSLTQKQSCLFGKYFIKRFKRLLWESKEKLRWMFKIKMFPNHQHLFISLTIIRTTKNINNVS